MQTFILQIRSMLQCRRGAVAVEFAMISMIFLLMIIGIIELGRIFWIENTLQFAAEETARYAMVHQTADDSELTSYAETKLAGINAAQVSFSYTRETIDNTDFITIQTSMTVGYITSLLPGGPFNLTGSARAPLLE